MPRSYEKDRDARIARGESTKDAKKFAAIDYFKKTGKAVNSVDKKGKKKGK